MMRSAAIVIALVVAVESVAFAQVQAAQAVQELNGVSIMLQKVDQDYQGRRVKAIKHIARAISHLGGQTARAPNDNGKEKPKVAEEELKLAIQFLRGIDKQLKGTNPEARREIGHAIQELTDALK